MFMYKEFEVACLFSLFSNLAVNFSEMQESGITRRRRITKFSDYSHPSWSRGD